MRQADEDRPVAAAAPLPDLREVFDAIGVFVAVLDPRGCITDLNATALRLADRPRGELLGTPFLGAFAWNGSVDAPARLRMALDAALGGEARALDVRGIGQGGAVDLDLTLTPLRGPDGAVHSLVASGVDARRRKRAEERLRIAMEAAGLGTWDTDLCTGERTWSERTRAMLGLPPDAQITRERFLSCVHPADRAAVEDAIERCRDPTGSGDYACEFRAVHPDGALRWIAARGRTIVSTTGGAREAVRIIGSCLDVTERRTLEAELRAARDAAERANQSKTRFLAAASHDLRQPAQSLTLFIDLLADRLRASPERVLVEHLERAVDAMRMLLDGILDVSRLDAGIVKAELADVALGPLFQRIRVEYAPRAAEKGLRLRVVDTGAWVRSDPGLLDRVLRNLLDNAMKYTVSGGIVLGVRRRGGRLRLDVVDTGIGMPDDRLGEIFEEFVQLGNAERDRRHGLGLGLAIVRRLADLMGHGLDVRSRAGRGSRFSVLLPSEPRRAAAAPHALPETDRECGGLAVVVDDEAMVLTSLQLVLEQWGWTVLAAVTAEEAVELVRRAGRRPDVIVADHRLRDGRTGVEAIRDLHALCGQPVPAIVLTGDTSPERIQEARRSGFTVLHKPVTLPELSARLAEARAERRRLAPG